MTALCTTVNRETVVVGRGVTCYHEVKGKRGWDDRDCQLMLKSILRLGFETGRNKKIVPGVYAFPRPMHGKVTDCTLALDLWPESSFFDTDTEWTLDAYLGFGNRAWDEVWWLAAKKAGYLFPRHVSERQSDDILARLGEFYQDKRARRVYTRAVAKILLSCGVDLLSQGGEIVIINPRAISEVRRPKLTERAWHGFASVVGHDEETLDKEWARGRDFSLSDLKQWATHARSEVAFEKQRIAKNDRAATSKLVPLRAVPVRP